MLTMGVSRRESEGSRDMSGGQGGQEKQQQPV